MPSARYQLVRGTAAEIDALAARREGEFAMDLDANVMLVWDAAGVPYRMARADLTNAQYATYVASGSPDNKDGIVNAINYGALVKMREYQDDVIRWQLVGSASGTIAIDLTDSRALYFQLAGNITTLTVTNWTPFTDYPFTPGSSEFAWGSEARFIFENLTGGVLTVDESFIEFWIGTKPAPISVPSGGSVMVSAYNTGHSAIYGVYHA